MPILAHDPAPVAATPHCPAYAPTQSPGPPRPLKDEFRSLPGSTPERVRELAWRPAHRFGDQTSIGFYIMVLSGEYGAARVEGLLAAYGAGRSRLVRLYEAGQSSAACGVAGGRRYYRARSNPTIVRLIAGVIPVRYIPQLLFRV